MLTGAKSMLHGKRLFEAPIQDTVDSFTGFAAGGTV
jgi:hypothetical protein